MKNVIDINGYKAVLSYDPDIGMIRGEFSGRAGGADIYASSVDGLREEGAKSLQVFLDMCQETGLAPQRGFSGRFNLRLAPHTDEVAVMAAASQSKSLNEWVAEAIEEAARAA